MAKEFQDKFFEELKGGVIDDRTPLERRKAELQEAIDQMEADVIHDPKALDKLKKELASVEKQMKEESKKAVEQGNIVGKQATEQDVDKNVKEAEEKEEEIKDEKKLNEEKKDEVAEAKQAYHDAMVALHEKRMQTIAKQKSKSKVELVSDREDYEQELQLEAKLYAARDAYMKFGKEDPYTEKRTEHIKLEKEAREPIEMELRNRAKRFKEIEQQTKQIDKEEREINEKLIKGDLNETQYKEFQDRLVELGEKRTKLELERATVKENLEAVIVERRERASQRAGLEQKHVETLSYEDKRNYDYQQGKIAEMNHNFDQATKQHYDNIKRRIEEREQKIKDINKELKEVPAEDFEKRLVLLNELDKETGMLEADREAKSDLDRGVVPDKQEMIHDAVEKADNEEYRQKEFDKATDEARAVVEQQKEEIGTAVIENPTIANIEEKERETTLKAATVAAVVDSPAPGPDTPLQNAAQFTVAKCVISGLEDQVRDPNNPEDAQAMIAENEQIDKANEELNRVQSNIEKQVQI